VTLKVTTFSHTIASASPLEVLRNALFSVANGEQAVSGELLNWLIPCNLRKRRLLRRSDLYRGFESTPLRTQSGLQRNSDASSSEYAKHAHFPRYFARRNGLERTHLLGSEEALSWFFSGGHRRSPVSGRD